MKTNDGDSRKAALQKLLLEIADAWSLGRALLEHERASSSPANQPFSEKEMITLCLVEQFGGMVTATTLCKVFGIHPSQVSKVVDGLVTRELLKKSTKSISRKSGQGTALQLTPKAIGALKEIKYRIGAGFEYLYEGFNAGELEMMSNFVGKTQTAAKKRFMWNVFKVIDPESP